jgi:hypothetical protein
MHQALKAYHTYISSNFLNCIFKNQAAWNNFSIEVVSKYLTLWLNSFLVGVPLLVFIRPLSFSFVGLLACCICML